MFLFDANSLGVLDMDDNLQMCLPPVLVLFTHTNLDLPTRVCQLKFAV